jgi:hypothetical protein
MSGHFRSCVAKSFSPSTHPRLSSGYELCVHSLKFCQRGLEALFPAFCQEVRGIPLDMSRIHSELVDVLLRQEPDEEEEEDEGDGKDDEDDDEDDGYSE